MDRNSSKGADMTDTATTPTFTDQTWADLGTTGLTRETSPQYWMKLHDLAVEAYETTRGFCPLSFDEWRSLVDATSAGLPITIARHDGRGTTHTATYIVEQIMSLSDGTTSNLRVRTWGFSYPLALGDLEHVEVPPVTYA